MNQSPEFGTGGYVLSYLNTAIQCQVGARRTMLPLPPPAVLPSPLCVCVWVPEGANLLWLACDPMQRAGPTSPDDT